MSGKSDSSNKSQNNSSRLWFIAIPFFIAIIVICFWYRSCLMETSGDMAFVGQVGDAFGWLNALFSGLAFCGLIVAILLQREELKLQREELEETRKELKGQKEQLEAQNTTFQRQRFEGTFFSMLEILRNRAITNSLDRSKVNSIHSKPISRLSKIIISAPYTEDLVIFPGTKKALIDIFDRWWNEVKYDVDSYLQLVTTVNAYVNTAEVTRLTLYRNIFRSSLSKHELILLYYFLALSKREIERDEEWSYLLKGLIPGDLLNKTHDNLWPNILSSANPADNEE